MVDESCKRRGRDISYGFEGIRRGGRGGTAGEVRGGGTLFMFAKRREYSSSTSCSRGLQEGAEFEGGVGSVIVGEMGESLEWWCLCSHFPTYWVLFEGLWRNGTRMEVMFG